MIRKASAKKLHAKKGQELPEEEITACTIQSKRNAQVIDFQ
jgi:hypothetical protein